MFRTAEAELLTYTAMDIRNYVNYFLSFLCK